MKITNRDGLPSNLAVALHADDYSKGKADISVTELIDSPRIRLMRQLYGDVVSVDLSDAIWPLLGTAFHTLMKQNENHNVTTEERLFAEVNGWSVSGQIDRVERFDNRRPLLSDYKVTSVYTVMNGRREWEDQLNIYGWLWYLAHGEWPDLEVVALARDWRPLESRTQQNYPKQITRIPIARRTPENIEAYIAARVLLHQRAQAKLDAGEGVVHCDATDMWQEPDKYAVMPKGAKRATRVFDSLPDAEAFAHRQTPRSKYEIQHREGGARRCELYCIFSQSCEQYQSILGDKLLKQAIALMD